MSKEIPAELLKQIEDEAAIRYPYLEILTPSGNEVQSNERLRFIKGAMFGYSLSPSSGEGEGAVEHLKLVEKELRHIILAFPVHGDSPYYHMIGEVFKKVKAANSVIGLNSIFNTTEPGQGVKTAEEILKEVACDFFWECRLDVQKNGYQEVRKMFDSWLAGNHYIKNKINQYHNLPEPPKQ